MQYKFLRFPGGKPKAVTLSYDDGCPEDVKLMEILFKYGMKCTFNVNGTGQTRWGLSVDKIKDDIKSGTYEIAVHGELHRAEGTLRPIEGIRDVLNCRMGLEETYGTIIRGMAYPDSGIKRFSNGSTYEKVKNYLTELDIVYARSLGADNDSFELPQDWHNWILATHHNSEKFME